MLTRRSLINALRFVLEELLPPAIRDRRSFMALPMRVLFGKDAPRYEHFKRDAVSMTVDEMADVYAGFSPRFLRRGSHFSDLNQACLDHILMDVAPYGSALDIGCGSGFLAKQIRNVVPEVTGGDIWLEPDVLKRYPEVTFKTSNVEDLDFPDDSFDVVVATHTLEHVPDLPRAISEMRRVARHMIVVVVPKERPYRHTLNLHLHFFPYEESLLLAVRPGPAHWCRVLGGDIYFREHLQTA